MSGLKEQKAITDRWNSRNNGDKNSTSIELAKKFFLTGLSGGFGAGICLFLISQHKVPNGWATVLAALISGVFSVIVAVIQSKRS